MPVQPLALHVKRIPEFPCGRQAAVARPASGVMLTDKQSYSGTASDGEGAE
jgi:hypothetical protein